MKRRYAGIGPRKTPEPYLSMMTKIAAQLAVSDWILSSGHAAGADEAFEIGTPYKQIFLPWEGYRNGRSDGKTTGVLPHTQKQLEIAQAHHPAWHRCSDTVRLLLARNVPILLGETLDNPVDMIVTWMPPGPYKGGTSHALRMASTYGIPVFNIRLPEDQKGLVTYVSGTRNDGSS